MQSVCISIVAFSATEQDYETFKNTLSLAIKCAGDALYLGELNEANLLVIWVKSDEDRKIFDTYQHDYPAEQLVLIASDAFVIDAYWQVSYPQNALMPSVLGITNLLGRIQAFFFLNQEFDTSFVPNESLYGLIDDALIDGIARKCTYPSCPDVYIAPNESAFFLQQSVDAIIPLILADSQAVTVTEISDEHIDDIFSSAPFSSSLPQYVFLNEGEGAEPSQNQTYHRYPLRQLQAFVILIASQGRLLDGHSLADNVFLKQQPDGLGLEEYGEDYQRIADCMGNGPLSLKMIAEKTQCPLFQVIGFYNVCSVFDFIGQGAAVVAVESDDTVFIGADDPIDVVELIGTDETYETAGFDDAVETEGMIGPAEEAETLGFFDATEWTETEGMIGAAEEAETLGFFDTTEWMESDTTLDTVVEAFDETIGQAEISGADQPSAPVTIESAFNDMAAELNGRVKIIIGGNFGAGKSTAIATLSDSRPISTETPLKPSENGKKATTTVALDYGKMRLHEGLALVLYGTPGLKRFDFMFPILCGTAWGIVLLIDNAESEPLAELDRYLKLAEQFVGKMPIAIGVTHYDVNAQPSVAEYKSHLGQRGLSLAVMPADARDKESLAALLCALAA